MHHVMRRCAITAVFCLAGATAAQAQGLPDVPASTVLTEVMMDAQGTEALLYGAFLGVSPTSPQMLSGTTSTDVAGGSFSFSLNPGSTYLGQAISDSVQGQFNAMTGSYDWTGSGAFGGFDWTVGGRATPIEIDITGPTWKTISEGALSIPLGKFSVPDQVTIMGNGIGKPALSVRTASLLDPAANQRGTITGTDTYDPNTGNYIFKDLFKPGPGFPVRKFLQETSGTTPAAEGAGTYTTTLSSVPELPSWAMALVGTLGLLARAGWMRTAARARAATATSGGEGRQS